MLIKRNVIRFRTSPSRLSPEARGYPEVSMDSSTYIDDDDPSVHYTNNWTSNSTQTTHSTTFAGSQSSVTFNGSLITVYGVVPATDDNPLPPSASYLIDGSLVSTQTQNYSSKGIRPFFTSPPLSNTSEHTLIINVTDAASGYFLDYFLVVSNPTPLTTSTASIAPTSPAHHGLSTTSKVAAIVGSVIGSATLLLLVFTVWKLFLRKKRLPESESESEADAPPLPSIGFTPPSLSSSNNHDLDNMLTTPAPMFRTGRPGTSNSSQFAYFYEKSARAGATGMDVPGLPRSPKTPTTCSDVSTLRFAP